MTDTFRVNAKTVDFRALSAKYPQNGTFFTTTRKLSIVNQNEVYGCDRIFIPKRLSIITLKSETKNFPFLVQNGRFRSPVGQ